MENPEKLYNAPGEFVSKGNGAEYKIEWRDDNSLRIINNSFDDDFEYYFDVIINEYGEAEKIVNCYTESDKYGKNYIEKRDFWYVPKYNSAHQLTGLTEKDEENGTVETEWQYIYNSQGQRTKRLTVVDSGTYETLYEYNKDGNLIKSVHKKFEPTGEDRIYNYGEYTTGKYGLSTGTDGTSIPAFSADEYLKNNKDKAYVKVTKAQHNFFYNTLIY